MALDPEPIYAALLARLQTRMGTACNLYSRRELDFDAIAESQLPALLCFATTAEPLAGPNYNYLPAKWRLGALVVCYVRAKATDAARVETQLTALLKSVSAALESTAGEGADARMGSGEFWTSLGGLVLYARVAGRAEFLPGADSDQGAVLIPVEMEVAT